MRSWNETECAISVPKPKGQHHYTPLAGRVTLRNHAWARKFGWCGGVGSRRADGAARYTALALDEACHHSVEGSVRGSVYPERDVKCRVYLRINHPPFSFFQLCALTSARAFGLKELVLFICLFDQRLLDHTGNGGFFPYGSASVSAVICWFAFVE